ncbi:MAG: hypothetical protein M1816_003059 [Peltula sp. TS41687]|nr:MAG: hypothetical protein M1816_003059 [Peltula sp. TS41687]
MPLNLTSAPSSRVKKPKSKPSLRKSLSAGALGSPRRQAARQSESGRGHAYSVETLPDAGVVVKLAEFSFVDVPQAIRYVQNIMFDDVLERASGLNSVRISETLNFRSSLPPIVTLAHIHALLDAPSTTDREVARLRKDGIVRQVVVPGRGSGAAGAAEGLVLFEDWQRLITETSSLQDNLKSKYVKLLHDHPTSRNLKISQIPLTEDEIGTLVHAGFFTVSNQSLGSMDVFARPGAGSSGTLASIASSGSQHVSGSLGAIGGYGAVHEAGGAGGGVYHREPMMSSSSNSGWPQALEDFRRSGQSSDFTLPSTGPYLRLLFSARSHLMSLLTKSRFKEAPLDFLRERWDGGIATDDPASKAKKARGEFVGVLPGKTRKWKQFHGLRFEWVLGECVGAGLMELFDTGSVGKGVRAR